MDVVVLSLSSLITIDRLVWFRMKCFSRQPNNGRVVNESDRKDSVLMAADIIDLLPCELLGVGVDIPGIGWIVRFLPGSGPFAFSDLIYRDCWCKS